VGGAAGEQSRAATRQPAPGRQQPASAPAAARPSARAPLMEPEVSTHSRMGPMSAVGLISRRSGLMRVLYSPQPSRSYVCRPARRAWRAGRQFATAGGRARHRARAGAQSAPARSRRAPAALKGRPGPCRLHRRRPATHPSRPSWRRRAAWTGAPCGRAPAAPPRRAAGARCRRSASGRASPAGAGHGGAGDSAPPSVAAAGHRCCSRTAAGRRRARGWPGACGGARRAPPAHLRLQHRAQQARAAVVVQELHGRAAQRAPAGAPAGSGTGRGGSGQEGARLARAGRSSLGPRCQRRM
jgi:hypothetical protein